MFSECYSIRTDGFEPKICYTANLLSARSNRMKLGSMQIADKPVPVFSVGDSWYRIECLWPETKGRDLLSLVSDDMFLERLHPLSQFRFGK